MTRNEIRETIDAEINSLAAERDNPQTSADRKAAAQAAIAQLQARWAAMNVAAADALGAQVDALVDQLEAVQTEYSLDAVSAVGRTIERLRTMAQGGNG